MGHPSISNPIQKRVIIEDVHGRFTVESRGDVSEVAEFMELLIIPAMVAAGFGKEEIDKYFRL